MDNPEGHWRVDRRIPLLGILAVFVQVGVGVYWLAVISENVRSNRAGLEAALTRDAMQWERIRALEIDNSARAEDAQQTRTLVLGLKESVSLMRSDIKDTNALLQALLRDLATNKRGKDQ